MPVHTVEWVSDDNNPLLVRLDRLRSRRWRAAGSG